MVYNPNSTVNPDVMPRFDDAAREHFKMTEGGGWEWLPLKEGQKSPYSDDWSSGPWTLDWFRKEFNRGRDMSGPRGLGIRTGQLVAYDIDLTAKHASLIEELQDVIRRCCGEPVIHRIGSKPGGQLWYRIKGPEFERKIIVSGFDPDGVKQKIEVLGRGGQVAAIGHISKGVETPFTYSYPNGRNPLNTRFEELSEVAPEQVIACLEPLKAAMRTHGFTKVEDNYTESGDASCAEFGDPDVPYAEFVEVIAHVSPATGRDEWIKMAGAFKNTEPLLADAPDDFDMEACFLEWSRGDYWAGDKAQPEWIERAGMWRPSTYVFSGEHGSITNPDESVLTNFQSMRVKADGSGYGSLKAAAKLNGWRDPAMADIHRGGNLMEQLPVVVTEESPSVLIYQSDRFRKVANPVNPWAEFSAPEFPFEALPEVVRDFVAFKGEQTGCDPAAIAMACMASLSGAIPHTIRIKLGEDYTRSPVMWVVLVGQPSAKKSVAMEVALARLKALDFQTRDDHTKQCDIAKLAGDKTRLDFLDDHPARQCIMFNASIEKMGQILAKQDQGILLAPDEIASWIASMDYYKSGSGGGQGLSRDRGIWLQAYDSKSYAIQRISRPDDYVKNLSVSILGGIQPDIIRKSAANMQADGLMQRFMPVMMRKPHSWKEIENPKVGTDWEELVSSLCRLPPYPVVIKMSPEARQEFRRFSDKTFALQSNDAADPYLQSFFGKLDGMWGSICLILHMAEGADTFEPVPGSVAARASRIVEEFITPHALVFYNELMLETPKDSQAIASFLFEQFAKGKATVTKKELLRGPRCCRGLSTFEMHRKLAALVAMGWLDPDDDRPDCSEWHINPAIRSLEEQSRAYREDWQKLQDTMKRNPGRKGIGAGKDGSGGSHVAVSSDDLSEAA